MPHVSFNKLEDSERRALYRSLVKTLEKSFAQGKGFAVLQEFLTHTEREMLAKRLAVVVLIKREVPVSKIANILKMSRVTIDTMALKYEAGRYDQLVSVALKENSIGDLLDGLIKNMNTAGGLMPPYVGRGQKKSR